MADLIDDDVPEEDSAVRGDGGRRYPVARMDAAKLTWPACGGRTFLRGTTRSSSSRPSVPVSPDPHCSHGRPRPSRRLSRGQLTGPYPHCCTSAQAGAAANLNHLLATLFLCASFPSLPEHSRSIFFVSILVYCLHVRINYSN